MPDFTLWTWQDYCFYGGICLIFLGFTIAVITDVILARCGKKEHTSFFTTALLWIIFTAGWYYGIGWLLGKVI